MCSNLSLSVRKEGRERNHIGLGKEIGCFKYYINKLEEFYDVLT